MSTNSLPSDDTLPSTAPEKYDPPSMISAGKQTSTSVEEGSSDVIPQKERSSLSRATRRVGRASKSFGKGFVRAPSRAKAKFYSGASWANQFTGIGDSYNKTGINITPSLSIAPPSGILSCFSSSYYASYNPYKYGTDRRMADTRTQYVADWVQAEKNKPMTTTNIIRRNPTERVTIPYVTVSSANQSYLDTAASMVGSCLGTAAHWMTSAGYRVGRQVQNQLHRRAPDWCGITAATGTGGWERSGRDETESGKFGVGEELTLEEAVARLPAQAGFDVYSTMV